MKKYLLILSLLAISVIQVMGQSAAKYKSNYPYWTISKDIQRHQFRDVLYVPAAPATGDVAWVASKNVTHINRQRTFLSRPVKMGGTPVHVVSKGIARMQMGNAGK
jgi:hypothetical protein